MRSSTPRIPVLAALLAIALALAGCGGSGSDDKGGGNNLTVAALPLVDGAALHIAIKNKFFDAEGLKVSVKPVAQSTAALPALIKGEVNVIAGANYVTFLQANEKGTLKLRVLHEAATLRSNMLDVLVMPNSPIRRPKDLEGKTLAVNILNNIQSLSLNAIFAANNVDAAKVKYRAVPFPQMAAALEKGDVDAIEPVEPFVSDIRRKLGARIVVDGAAPPVTDLPASGYVTTEEFVSKNPRAAAGFQRAIAKAQQMAAGDRKKVEEVLPGYARIRPDVAAVISLPGFPTSSDPARLKRLVDLMTGQGLLKTPPDLNALLYKAPA